MNKSNYSIWFWQRMLTPHMGSLAEALTKQGYSVTFVANEILSNERKFQGWNKAHLVNAKFILSKDIFDTVNIAEKAPEASIHFCEGLRKNGFIREAQKIIRRRGLRHFTMIEKIDERGFKSIAKKLLYRILFLYWQKSLEGVLAIGNNTRRWIVEQGMNNNQVYSFAYFLKEPNLNKNSNKLSKKIENDNFHFIYVGQLIDRKKIDLLITSIANLKSKDIELLVVGDGPKKQSLKLLADKELPQKVRWLGTLPMSEVSKIIFQADCLVLPSSHDGWGAVTSEALMVGTPVITSDACGSSEVVKASGVGGVFLSNNRKSLKSNLQNQYNLGRVSIKERNKISKWAKCLGANSGAKYLDLIIQKNHSKKSNLSPPWEI